MFSSTNTGYRKAVAPTVTTSAQNTANANSSGFVALALLAGGSIPEVTSDDAGICIGTSGSPAPGVSGSVCLFVSSDACKFAAAKPIGSGNRTISCTFTGLTPDAPYFVQAFARNAKTWPSYVLGGRQTYTTTP